MLNSFAAAPYYVVVLLSMSLSSPGHCASAAFVGRQLQPQPKISTNHSNRNVAPPPLSLIRTGHSHGPGTVSVVLSAEKQESQQQPDQYSEAFTAYMTKSHEEKLKAVKVAEDNKNAEIKALKQQLEGIKNGIVPSTAATSDASLSQSLDEISSKLTAYQNFMSEYIVKAQEEKRKAVIAAEKAIATKYEGRLDAILLQPVDANAITVPSQETKGQRTVPIETYEKRSETVKAAGEAGKSRWGSEEVQRISSMNK